MKLHTIGVALILACCLPVVADENKPPVSCWLQSSLQRVYPRSEPPTAKSLRVPARRTGQFSFQAGVRNAGTTSTPRGKCEVTSDSGLAVQVRRVGFVPMGHFTTDTTAEDLDGHGHVPGLVPDPLF